jgi:putative tryptophan/tyrosine transport system substrate-binding protein
MRRRDFMAILGGVATARQAFAQQTERVPRIGVLSPGTSLTERVEAFHDGLRALGYVVGRNIVVDTRFADGRNEALPRLARELVDGNADIIVAINTQAAQAAQRASSTVPIVFVRGADPVRSGLVAGLARPGGHVTGISALADELGGKRLELLKQALPGLRRIAVLWNAGNPGAEIVADELARTSRELGIELQRLPVQSARDLAPAVDAAMQERADALVVVDDVLVTTFSAPLMELAANRHLPVTAFYREFAQAGALLAYGPNIPAIYRRAAYYVDRILKGAKPADLPVEQPTKLDLIVNLRAAEALGLALPSELLARADEVIE